MGKGKEEDRNRRDTARVHASPLSSQTPRQLVHFFFRLSLSGSAALRILQPLRFSLHSDSERLYMREMLVRMSRMVVLLGENMLVSVLVVAFLCLIIMGVLLLSANILHILSWQLV